MIHPDVREALEEIQQNLKNEMISAKVMLKEYGDKSGIHACHRDRLFGCIENAVEVYDEILYPEKYGMPTTHPAYGWKTTKQMSGANCRLI